MIDLQRYVERQYAASRSWHRHADGPDVPDTRWSQTPARDEKLKGGRIEKDGGRLHRVGVAIASR